MKWIIGKGRKVNLIFLRENLFDDALIGLDHIQRGKLQIDDDGMIKVINNFIELYKIDK
jgi:hypothetical protein